MKMSFEDLLIRDFFRNVFSFSRCDIDHKCKIKLYFKFLSLHKIQSQTNDH